MPTPGRACDPDEQGAVVRDGVRSAWSVYGAGHRPTVLLMPTWSIVSSRLWKGQVGHLSRHYRVVSFDGRGSGASDRPGGAAAYGDVEYARDALAVLDATGTEQAVVVSLSRGAAWSVHLAAAHPERVLGLFALSPSLGLALPHPEREQFPWDGVPATADGWAGYNRDVWLSGGYDGFLPFFFGEMFSEPHATKPVEDGIGWGREVAPRTLVDTVEGALGLGGADSPPLEPLCRRVRCPVVVLHGTQDRVRPHASGERLAELTGGALLLVEGGGHGLPATEPVLVNERISAFVDRLCPPAPRRTTWTRAARRPRRALYLSSPIGLGHARRDLAVADELRLLHPDLQVDWLTQHPVTAALRARGEHVHPASALLASESAHVEAESGEHDLHAFQAVRRMDEVLVSNAMVFLDVVRDGAYDLVVGDEAWDVDHLLHENPERKAFAYAWMTDFVGWLPVPAGGEREAELAADANAQMLEQRARYRRVRDASVFVGDPEDVVPGTFGPGLPGIAEWTAAHFTFPGYVTGFDPAGLTGRRELRRSLGVGDDDRLCVVSVGGSGVGGALLRRALDAAPCARQLVPGLRFLVVTGPRIDPRSLPPVEGVQAVGYLPDLQAWLDACDVAVVQGGLTTCMELTALRKPFVYVPLQDHFEQTFHVRHRLERYRAGGCLPYAEARVPELLAAAVAAELVREVDYLPVATDGAARTARLLSDLL